MEETDAARPKKKSRLRRIVMWLIVTLLLLVLVLPTTLYIPVVQDWVSSIVVSYLNDNDPNHSYTIGKVRIGFPLQLKVEDVNVQQRSDGSILLHVGLLQTGLDDIPINQPYFVLNHLKVRDVVMGMDTLTQSVSLSGSVAQIDVSHIEYDPNNNLLRVRDAVIGNPNLRLAVGPSVPDTTQSTPWDVLIETATLTDGQIAFEMNDSILPVLSDSLGVSHSSSLDYQHLSLTGVNALAEKIVYNPDCISAQVKQLTAREENCGLELSQLAVGVQLRDDVIALKQIDLQLTPDDYLMGDLNMDFRMFDSIPSGAVCADLKLSIDSANLVRLAAPYLDGMSDHWVSNQTEAQVTARLSPDSLDLQTLTLRIPNHIDVQAEGVATQVFDNLKRHAALTVRGDLLHTDDLISAFVAPRSRRAYQVPDSLQFEAEIAQIERAFDARIDMTMSDKEVLQGTANYDFKTERYQVRADIDRLNVSAFVAQVPADAVTARLEAEGQHLQFPGKNTQAEVRMTIYTLHFVNPDGTPDWLQDLDVTASLNAGRYDAELHSLHPHLMLDSHLSGTFLKDSLSVDGYIDMPVARLDLLPYGYAQPGMGQLGFRSRVQGSYNWTDIADITLHIDSLTYSDQNTHTHFDDILVDITSEPGILDADLKGGDANVCIKVNRSVNEMSGVLDTLLTEWNRQVELFSFDFSRLRDCLPLTDVDLKMGQENPFYQAFEYHTGYTFESADLQLRNDKELRLNGEVLALSDQSGSIDFDTIAVDLRPCGVQAPDAYHYALHATHIDPRARKSYDVHCGGKLMPDSLTAGLKYVNGNYLTLYDVEASLAVANDSVTFHLEKDPTIYEQPFTVNTDNYFSLMHFLNRTDRHFDTRARMKLQGPRDMLVNIYSRRNKEDHLGNRLLFQVRNLDLAYATDVMESDYDAAGRMNVSASVNLYPDSVTARLRSGIKDFRFGQYCADTLSFTGRYQLMGEAQRVNGVLTVEDIVKLTLNAALDDSVKVRAEVDELPLPLVNAFLPSNMQLYGYTSGHLSIMGKDMDHAKVDAAMALVDAGMTYSDLDAMFRFSPDTLRITNKRLKLNDYKIYAAGGNPLKVKGTVDFTKDLGNPAISLNLQSDQLRLIDNRRLRLKDQYLYGTLPVSPNIKIRGTLAKMDVTGSVRLLSGTNLNYFMTDDPLQSSSKVDQLVDFVSFKQMDNQFGAGQRKRRPPMQDHVDEGLNVDLKIEIAKDMKVAAHLAGTDNNRVDIVGGGSLNLQCDANGDLIMNGTYDITSGKVDYKIPVLPVVKTFDIANSSMVYWEEAEAGNPTISIQAVEHVKATVNDDAGSRLVNFLVTINIAGTLDHLNMTFDCDAPDDGAVSTDLATLDADERSKNAIILLLAQTYIGPGNQSSVGLGAANAALNSMLNRKMDSMLGNMKGTNIDLGIDTYSTESGNTRTDYSVKVSQNLFNDRFRATIGGQISSGGEVGQSNGARLGDMSLEWLIKKDGSHYLKLFRRTNYESVLEGELIETGVSYVQERSGYKFRQLLLPTNQRRQQKVEEMVRQLIEQEETQESDPATDESATENNASANE